MHVSERAPGFNLFDRCPGLQAPGTCAPVSLAAVPRYLLPVKCQDAFLFLLADGCSSQSSQITCRNEWLEKRHGILLQLPFEALDKHM